jgi:hypothetical protein
MLPGRAAACRRSTASPPEEIPMRYPLPRRTLVTAASLLLAAPLVAALAAQAPAGAAPSTPNPPMNPPTTGVTSDPKAVAVADATLAAMGGQAAWDGTHYLRLTFAGRRTHFWDKWTGRHRLEGKTKDNEAYVVLDNVNTHQGTAYMGGKPVEGDKGAKMVENSYAAWINDTYWLLMPYKLKDSGVNLSYVGEQQLDGKDYDELGLTFGPVGLTPGDHYFAWFNRGTHLMDRWAYLLQDQPRDAAPTVWLWQGWQRYGQVMLAPHRVSPDGQKKLELSDILVAASLPDAVFTSPAPVPPIQANQGGAATSMAIGHR